MSVDNFFSYSIDSSVINHYLQLLAQRQIQLEQQVAELSAQLQQSRSKPTAQYWLEEKPCNAPVQPIVDLTEHPKLMAQLLEYLPAIFPNFWNSVSPAELTQLLGVKEKPRIPSPFYYPDNSAVYAAREQIQQLSVYEVLDIRKVCRNLQQRYNLSTHHAWFDWLQ